MKKIFNEKGFVLPIVLVMLVFIFIIGSAVLLMSKNNYKTINAKNDKIKALYIAEAGIERTIYELNNDLDDDWSNSSPSSAIFTNEAIQYTAPLASFSGQYDVVLSNRTTDDLQITSTGKFNNSNVKLIVRVSKK